MKKTFIGIGGALVCAGILAGCATGSHSQAQEEYEKFKKERPKVSVALTGDNALDSTAKLSAELYGQTVKFLDEYIAKTDNHRQVVGFYNEVQNEMKENKVSEAQAIKKVTEQIEKADAKKTENEKIMPKVLAGQKAVESLQPKKKLLELAPLSLEAAKLSLQAQKLSNSFSGFDASTIKKGLVATNIIKQTKYTADALKFLTRQYQMNQAAMNYMKK